MNHLPTAVRRNIELKARCADLASARRAALALGATDAGVLHQRDTYFRVPHGRLKLREINGTSAELIAYDRPDHPDRRASDYVVAPVPDPAATLAALTRALGLRGVVAKRRQLLLWHGSTELADVHVRIHLDDVESLGPFVEFEAVLSPHHPDEPLAHARLAELTAALGIRPEDRVAGSYSDLMGL